jgi:hypothetical protein
MLLDSPFFWGSPLHKHVTGIMKETQAFATQLEATQQDRLVNTPTSPTTGNETTTPPASGDANQMMADLLAKALLAQTHHGLGDATLGSGQPTGTVSPTGLSYNQLFLTVFLEFYKQITSQAEVEASVDNPALPDDSILARQRRSPALNWTF